MSGTVDKVVKSDEKVFISPPIHLKTFLEEALKREEQLQNFFNAFSHQTEYTFSLPQKQTGGNALQLQQLQETEENVQASTSEISLPPLHTPVMENAADNTRMDGRTRFKHFLQSKGQTASTAEEAMHQVDSTTEFIYANYPINEFMPTYPPQNSKLLSHQMLHELRKYNTTAVKNQYAVRGKYFKYREQALKRKYCLPDSHSAKDILLTVHLLTGMNRTPQGQENIALRKRCEVKLLIRGDMPLVKLREKIFCSADFWCNLEDFEDAKNPTAYFSHRFPSGFLFIHDTFYVDRRNELAIDTTEPIRQFLDRKKEFGAYHVKDITEARVIDLSLRLGQPCVFQHQGNCEHLIIFSDLRVMGASDEQDLTKYPIRLYESISQIMCCACRDSVAVITVTESDRMPMAPAFMCMECFRAFHFERNRRMGQFKAFHYIDRSGIE
jgi:snRNA-activating protein complex subunit 3